MYGTEVARTLTLTLYPWNMCPARVVARRLFCLGDLLVLALAGFQSMNVRLRSPSRHFLFRRGIASRLSATLS